MRILHVSNGNYKHRGKRYYDQSRKITNGLIRNGHDVYFLSDRDTARAAAFLKTKSLGKRALNRIFLDIVNHYAPHIILLGHADMITADSLFEAKEMLPTVRIGQWNVDAMFCPHNITMIHSKLAAVDATFCTTGGDILKQFQTDHGTVTYIPNMVDSSVEWPRAFEHSNHQHDVFWAARINTSGSYKGDARFEIPMFIEESGHIDIDYHGMNGREELFDHRYFEAINQCKMGLNISSVRAYGHHDKAPKEQLYLYSSDRISHYMGSGLLVFTSTDNHLETLFTPDEHIILYDSKETLLDKLRFYKANDALRQRIAYQGWQRAHNDFNSQVVTRYMLDVLLNKRLEKPVQHSQPYRWPIKQYSPAMA